MVPTVRLDHITPQLVDLAPRPLEPGVLYVSRKYGVAVHLCCCGCGEKVVTPLSEAEWQLNLQGGKVSLHPSVGNGGQCRSHYWIRQNCVVWAANMTRHQIARTRQSDRASIDAMYAARRKPQGANWLIWLTSLFETVKSWFVRR